MSNDLVQKKKYPMSKIIHAAVTIFLMFLFGRVIPPFGGITP